MKLAIDGGAPRFPGSWPQWPASNLGTEDALLRVARSGRWAISGLNAGEPAEERLFGDRFAAYLGSKYGVPVTNGSAALVVALEALGVRAGDEVLVPGVVWVACASAVARAGAIPVLVDVDETTFCMSPSAASAAITDRTSAILLVHLYSSVADLDAFVGLASKHGLALIEDCAQAHGAAWKGRRVGSIGDVGTFSFQNFKLLTAGEGGILVTSDRQVYDSAQQLRGDGRRWADAAPRIGYPDLHEVGERQGHNHCMTEFQAAILHANLPYLDSQNQKRLENVALESQLDMIDGVSVVRARDQRITSQTFYHLPIQVDARAFSGASGEKIGDAVGAELELFLEPVDPPLNSHPLYRPSQYTRFDLERRTMLDVSGYDLPNASKLALSCFTVPHYAFLASVDRVLDIARALSHVQRSAHEL